MHDPHEAGIDGFPTASASASPAAPGKGAPPSSAVTLDRVLSQFTEEARQGHAPSIEVYARRYPALAEDIRDVFPAVLALEQWKLDKEAECLRRNIPQDFRVRQLGDYKIVREIGRGGMGVVFEAVQERSQRRVAIKLLPWRYGSSVPRWRERFEAESRTIARLKHPNIISILGFGEQEGYCYIVMPLINGVSLDRIIHRLSEQEQLSFAEEITCVSPTMDTEVNRRHQPAGESPDAGACDSPSAPSTNGLQRDSWRDFARLVYQAARAVSSAHQQGVLHNDMKPANVLVDAAGRVMVGDFGLARERKLDHDLSDSSPGLSGTLRYMAPERFLGRCDERSDVYSLGATLYELATLSPAFAATNQRELIEAVSEGTWLPPRQANDRLPRALETVIQTAMAVNPAERYPSAEALAADLLRFANGRPIQARRRGMLRRLFTRCRRWFSRRK